MARSIFLSYRRDDSGGHTGRLYDRLVQQFGQKHVFLDIDNVPFGIDFVHAIDQTLDECAVVIVVIGPRWLTAVGADGERRIDKDRDFHRLEIERALAGQRRIVPVLVGGATMPQQIELPQSIEALARRNAFELTDRRFVYDAEKLVEVLKAALLEEEQRQLDSENRAKAEQDEREREARAQALKGAALRKVREDEEQQAKAERDRKEREAQAHKEAAMRRPPAPAPSRKLSTPEQAQRPAPPPQPPPVETHDRTLSPDAEPELIFGVGIWGTNAERVTLSIMCVVAAAVLSFRQGRRVGYEDSFFIGLSISAAISLWYILNRRYGLPKWLLYLGNVGVFCLCWMYLLAFTHA